MRDSVCFAAGFGSAAEPYARENVDAWEAEAGVPCGDAGPVAGPTSIATPGTTASALHALLVGRARQVQRQLQGRGGPVGRLWDSAGRRAQVRRPAPVVGAGAA